MTGRYLQISGPAESLSNFELVDLATFQAMNLLDLGANAAQQLVVNAVNADAFEYMRRRFVKDTGTDYVQVLDGSMNGRDIWLPIHPIVGVPTLERGYYNGGVWSVEHTYTVSEYVLEAHTGRVTMTSTEGLPGGPQSFKATYRAGFSTAPAGLQLAIGEIMGVEWKRLAAKRLDHVSDSNNSGSQAYTFDSWPPNARRVLDRYQRKDRLLV